MSDSSTGCRNGMPLPRRFAALWQWARVATWRCRLLIFSAVLSVLVLGATLAFAGWYLAQDERLGTLYFPTSCGWQSQRGFNKATALLHLFQFADAEAVYRLIIKRDPDCAIAYWGIAMSRLRNPLYALPDAHDIDTARQALRSAAAARAASPRERAYLAAVAKLFDVDPGQDWLIREFAYAGAMARVVAEYPQDREAKVFYALALNLQAPSTAEPGTVRAKAAELLLQVFAEVPDHPGLDHYLTYCLGHIRYQPKPFQKGGPVMTSAQRFPLAILAFVLLCGVGVFVAFTADFRPGPPGASGIGGPFALTASDGTLVTERSFRGRWVLMYFGYTHCPDICPTTLTAISQALEKLGPLAVKVQPLFVSIDPERDTPAAVGEFTKAFDSRIIGLTGKPAEIAAVAKEYRVFYKKSVAETDGEYWMEHSSYIYVIDPDGRYVTLIAGGLTLNRDDIASRLRGLLLSHQQSDKHNVSGPARTGVAA